MSEPTIITEEQAREWLREVITEFGPDHRAPKQALVIKVEDDDGEYTSPDKGCVYTMQQDDGTLTDCCIVGVIAHRKLGADLEELHNYDVEGGAGALAVLNGFGYTGEGVDLLSAAQSIQDGGNALPGVRWDEAMNEVVDDSSLRATADAGRPWGAVAKVLAIDLPE